VLPAAAADQGPVDAGIVVQKVEGMPRGLHAGCVDVSTVLSLEESGVNVRGTDGQVADPVRRAEGVRCTDVRVRVW